MEDPKLKELADLLEKHGLRKHLNINGFGYSQIERDIVSLFKPASPPSMPDLETCKDKVLEIIQKNYNEFKGTNEAELHSSHEIANWMRSQCDGLIKQKAVEFVEWMHNNNWVTIKIDDTVVLENTFNSEGRKIEQVYEIFNQQER